MMTGIAPIVSVIIPVYNASKFLEAAVQSISSQTLANVEIIAINDGSTDGSDVILDRLSSSDPRIKVVHTENRGIVSALNSALSLASGRYIARMDGDDIALPDRLRVQSEFLESHLDHSYVGSLFQVIDDNGGLGHLQRGQSATKQTDFSVFPPYVASVPHPTLMVRRDHLIQIGGYRDAFPHAEDHDLFIRLSRLGKARVIPELLLQYRIHSGSVSTKHSAVQLDSALRAQAVGLIAMRTGSEPVGVTSSLSLDDIVRDRDGLPTAAAWESLSALRQVEHDLDRRDAPAAWRSLARLALSIVTGAQALRSADAFGRMLKLLSRSAARSAAIQIRG